MLTMPKGEWDTFVARISDIAVAGVWLPVEKEKTKQNNKTHTHTHLRPE